MSKVIAEVSDFPIPYVMQAPRDDLRDALALLAIVDRYFDEGWKNGISKEAVADLSVAFGTACRTIKTVAAYLAADDREGTLELYQRVRREEIAECFDRGMS